MFLKPPPGQQYRDTRTRELVPETGLEFDVLDLDVARALEVGDLVPVNPKKTSAKAGAQE